MEQKSVNVYLFYWTTFILSITIILLNFGLALFVLGIFLLPVLGLHLFIGTQLHKIQSEKKLLLWSSLNLLFFSLVRIDGTHTMQDNGLSSFLDVFNIHSGYNPEWESTYAFACFISFILQIFIESRLFYKWKTSRKQTDQL